MVEDWGTEEKIRLFTSRPFKGLYINHLLQSKTLPWTTELWYSLLWNSSHDRMCTKGNCIPPSLSLLPSLPYMHTDTISEFTPWNELARIHQGPGIWLNPSCQEKIGLNWASEQMWRNKAQNSVFLCLPLLINTLIMSVDPAATKAFL